MHDDEQQLIRMLGLRSRALKIEQLIEREIRTVVQLLAQKVATSSAAISSTRIVSVVKNGSPYRQRINEP